MVLVNERFWIWGQAAGCHRPEEWGVPGPSRMTPLEGAVYMGVSNIIVVRYGDRPAPPYKQYSIPFRSLNSVVWSIVGAGGVTQEEERTQVLELAGHLPNMTGVMMDDFFKRPSEDGEVGVLSLDELRGIRNGLTVSGRKLDLWVVLYDHQLDLPVKEHLALCDKVSFWTWSARNLKNLERNFDAVEELAPSCGKVLGCYMWDYGKKEPMPVDVMRGQCEMGLQWLREGRIEGMIFLATCICDLDIEAVEWTRGWIAEVGGEEL